MRFVRRTVVATWSTAIFRIASIRASSPDSIISGSSFKSSLANDFSQHWKSWSGTSLSDISVQRLNRRHSASNVCQSSSLTSCFNSGLSILGTFCLVAAWGAAPEWMLLWLANMAMATASELCSATYSHPVYWHSMVVVIVMACKSDEDVRRCSVINIYIW